MSHPDRDGDPAAPRSRSGHAVSVSASGAGPGAGRALLILTQEQAAALRTVLEGYRQYAFSQLLPTAERNERLRQAQTWLARLHELAPPPGGECWLSLSPAELGRLRQLLQVVREQPTLHERWRPELQALAPLFGREDGSA
ncbi:hypothetical protein [Thermogemmatispora sp.]|uniref:hypothetical protein n=1 Tax=Thermogemmatispora sp. TaxID=1968838 RepID=UPI0035E3FD6C